jgi:hypothetical protein
MCCSVLALAEGLRKTKTNLYQFIRSPDQNFNLEPSSYKRECHSLDGDTRLSEILPWQLPGGGETPNYKPEWGQPPPGLGYEWSVFRIPSGSSTSFTGWKKETKWDRKGGTKNKQKERETKGREKGEKKKGS